MLEKSARIIFQTKHYQMNLSVEDKFLWLIVLIDMKNQPHLTFPSMANLSPTPLKAFYPARFRIVGEEFLNTYPNAIQYTWMFVIHC